MKTPHLLRVPEGTTRDALQPLVNAIAADGGRCGWLRWRPHLPLDEVLPPDGLLRDVTVGADGNVARKRRQGPPVLRDVLREHFRGCRLVLIQTVPADEAQDIAPDFGPDIGQIPAIDAVASTDREPPAFEVRTADRTRRQTAEDLAARLRRPHPF